MVEFRSINGAILGSGINPMTLTHDLVGGSSRAATSEPQAPTSSL